jgi:hypothetical protein
MTDLPNLGDVDALETQEWLEAIDSVLKAHGPERIEWPRCLHLGRSELTSSHPGMWLVEVTDDDAPEELNSMQVELSLARDGAGIVTVTGRDVVRF